ncbi:hypothetical protein B296_00007630, partial [Ensete ventricosum]
FKDEEATHGGIRGLLTLAIGDDRGVIKGVICGNGERVGPTMPRCSPTSHSPRRTATLATGVAFIWGEGAFVDGVRLFFLRPSCRVVRPKKDIRRRRRRRRRKRRSC